MIGSDDFEKRHNIPDRKKKTYLTIALVCTTVHQILEARRKREMENARMGKINELKFEQWMNFHHIPYFRIDQTKESFADALKEDARRADYFIGIPGIGSFMVDAKFRSFNKIYATFKIEKEEVMKLKKFQDVMNIPVWLVFSSLYTGIGNWYWIKIDNVVERIEQRTYKGLKTKFIHINVRKFTILTENDDLTDLIKKQSFFHVMEIEEHDDDEDLTRWI